MTPVSPLPGARRSRTAAELSAAIGAEATAALLAEFGGRRLYVPARPGPDHPITQAIGADAAARLAEYFAQVDLDLPISGSKHARVIAMRDAGTTSPRAIARVLHCSTRYVQKVLAHDLEARIASTQGHLFG